MNADHIEGFLGQWFVFGKSFKRDGVEYVTLVSDKNDVEVEIPARQAALIICNRKALLEYAGSMSMILEEIYPDKSDELWIKFTGLLGEK